MCISKGKIKSPPFLEGTTNKTIQTKSLYRYGRLHLFPVQDLQNPRHTDSDLTYGNAKYSNDCCFGFSPNSLLSTLQRCILNRKPILSYIHLKSAFNYNTCLLSCQFLKIFLISEFIQVRYKFCLWPAFCVTQLYELNMLLIKS